MDLDGLPRLHLLLSVEGLRGERARHSRERQAELHGHERPVLSQGLSCTSAGIRSRPDQDAYEAHQSRKGRGIDPGFVPITWDEALDAIADKLLELHENKHSERFMFIKGRSSEVGDALYHYFPALMGTPNYYGHSTICAEAEKAASWAVNGMYSYRDYDMENCKYFLMWSTDPIGSNRQQPAIMNHWGQIMDAAHIVCIDPRYSATLFFASS